MIRVTWLSIGKAVESCYDERWLGQMGVVARNQGDARVGSEAWLLHTPGSVSRQDWRAFLRPKGIATGQPRVVRRGQSAAPGPDAARLLRT